MRGLSINVQLVVLIVVDETTAFLEYREVRVVALREHVEVVAVRELRAHLHGLAVGRVELADGVDVRPVALLPALAQPHLRLAHVALQVVVDDIEVLEWRELEVAHERRLDQELALLRVDVEPVAGVDADLLADASYQPVHFLVEVGGVVDDVEVRVADPRGRRVVVQLPSQLHPLGPACVILTTKNSKVHLLRIDGWTNLIL